MASNMDGLSSALSKISLETSMTDFKASMRGLSLDKTSMKTLRCQKTREVTDRIMKEQEGGQVLKKRPKPNFAPPQEKEKEVSPSCKINDLVSIKLQYMQAKQGVETTLTLNVSDKDWIDPPDPNCWRV